MPLELHLFAQLPSPAAVAGSGTPRATRSAGGVEYSLQLGQGPFFLGEVVQVTIVLTNQNSIPVILLQPFIADSCSGISGSTRGGSAPFLALPPFGVPLCPANVAPNQVAPHQTLTAQFFITLTASHRVSVVSAEPEVYHTVQDSYSGKHPLGSGGWLTLPIDVAPAAPQGRILRLSYDGRAARVSVDSGALPPHLLIWNNQVYADSVSMSGGWAPLASAVIPAPTRYAAHKFVKWILAVGAPGDRFAGGIYR